jgi:hypothetical protein
MEEGIHECHRLGQDLSDYIDAMKHLIYTLIEKAFLMSISQIKQKKRMGQMRKKVRQAGVHYKECEPYSPFQNRAKAGIGEMKCAVKRSMVKKASPMRLWNYCAKL